MVESMSAVEIVIRIGIGVLLILFNAFLVAVEFGLTRARQYGKDEFVNSESRGLKKAWEMTEELEIYLTSCQVGISATSIALGIIAEPGLAALFNPLFESTMLSGIGAGSILGFGLINLIHLTHGEQTPTYLGVEKSKMVCKYGAMPLYWFTFFIRPIIAVGDTVAKFTLNLFDIQMTSAWVETSEETIQSRSELRNKLGNILNNQNISDERKEEVLATLDADKTTVKHRMVDVNDIASLSTESSFEENQQVIEEYPHSRYPLVGTDINDLRGIVYMEKLAREMYTSENKVDLQKIAEEPMTLSEETNVSTAIDKFQEASQEMAFVLDDTGNVSGLVTVTDVLEALVGEIEDPIDISQQEN